MNPTSLSLPGRQPALLQAVPAAAVFSDDVPGEGIR